jgi:hypothetical protein
MEFLFASSIALVAKVKFQLAAEGVHKLRRGVVCTQPYANIESAKRAGTS